MTDAAGMFYSRNNSPIQVHSFETPLTVRAGEEVDVYVNHVSNRRLGGDEWLGVDESLLPQLLADIGEGCRVNIVITNSANVAVETLSPSDALGGAGLKPVGAALISSIIRGSIGRYAKIGIAIKDSANLNFSAATRSLDIGQPRLIERLIEVASLDGLLEDVELSVEFLNSAQVKVRGDSVVQGEVVVREGQLVKGVLECSGIFNSNIQMVQTHAATVQAERLEISGGELVNEVISAHDIDSSDIVIDLKGSANVFATSLTINEGELVDEIIDVTGNITSSNIRITITDSANVSAATVDITNGELLDEVIDVGGSLESTSIEVDLLRSANIYGSAGNDRIR